MLNLPEKKLDSKQVRSDVEKSKNKTAKTNSLPPPPLTNSNEIIKIFYEQKIGRGYSYEVQLQNGKTEWVRGRGVRAQLIEKYRKEDKTIKCYLSEIITQQRPSAAKGSFNYLLIIILIASMINSTPILGNFNHCVSFIKRNEQASKNKPGIYIPKT
jgi:hypothetical protein